MKYLPMILLAICPACTVGYQGLLDEATVLDPNVVPSLDAATSAIPDALATDAGTTDARTELDAVAEKFEASAPDAACVPLTACLAVKPGCFTQQEDGCGGAINCALSKDCYPNVPDGAVACVVSACPTGCGQNSVPCCSMMTYGACGCTLGTVCFN